MFTLLRTVLTRAGPWLLGALGFYGVSKSENVTEDLAGLARWVAIGLAVFVGWRVWQAYR